MWVDAAQTWAPRNHSNIGKLFGAHNLRSGFTSFLKSKVLVATPPLLVSFFWPVFTWLLGISVVYPWLSRQRWRQYGCTFFTGATETFCMSRKKAPPFFLGIGSYNMLQSWKLSMLQPGNCFTDCIFFDTLPPFMPKKTQSLLNSPTQSRFTQWAGDMILYAHSPTMFTTLDSTNKSTNFFQSIPFWTYHCSSPLIPGKTKHYTTYICHLCI